MRGSRTNVDIGGVLQTGRDLDIRQALALPDFGAYTFPHPVDVALRIERIGGGLAVRGTVDATVGGECGRCLDPVVTPVHLDLDERFDPSADRADPLGESNVLTGDELDLPDLIRQLIDSALPLVLLCREECAGLCATCGQKRDDACRCQNPE